MSTINDTITENLGLSEALPVIIAPTMIEGLRCFDFIAPNFGKLVTATENLGMTDSMVPAYGVLISEHILLTMSQIDNYHFQAQLSEALGFVEQWSAGVPVSLTENLGVSMSLVAQQAISVIEQLGLVDTIAPLLTYHESIVDTMTLSDTLARFFGIEVIEALNLTDLMAGVALHPASVTENLDLTETLAPQLILRVTVEDSFALDDASILNMIYSDTITEEMQLSIGYISPGGGVATWAMNTRTAAVTEYTNYAFNSFAKMGHKYLGAAEDGLYELVGDDDAGTDIIAEIKSGLAQWAGSKFSMFQGAYLGVRGGGEFILKVITGDNKTYHYTVNAQDMRTTKITTGKGLRARYFAFHLISTGQDFDLDTIEFVPIGANRRV